MFDHASLGVANFDRAKAFYDAALKPLGYHCVMAFDGVAAYGASPEQPQLWIGQAKGEPVAPAAGSHIAFSAPDRPAVDAFHKAALAAGGRDNGAPGLRPHYHPDYYGAFVIDPDGHRIEAVCHRPG